MSCSLCFQNTDPPTDLSYFRLVEDPQRQVCKCVQTILPSIPSSSSLLLFGLPSLAPGSRKERKKEKKKTQQDRDESHIVCRAEFGRPQIKDSGRLVMIRGLG